MNRKKKQNSYNASNTNIKEIAKFIEHRYSYEEGLVQVTCDKSKIIVHINEDCENCVPKDLASGIETLNPKLITVRTIRTSSH